MSIKRIAINTAIVLGTLSVLFLIWEFREAVILFGFSLAIAAAARPYVELMADRGIPSALAIVIVYLVFIVSLVALLWAVGSSITHELQQLFDQFTLTYEQMWSMWPKGSQVEKLIIQQLPPPDTLYKSFSPERTGPMLNSLLGITMSWATLLGQFFTILMLGIYWSADRVHFERLWLSVLPVESRARSRDVWRDIERDFGGYVRSELLQSILAGVLLGFGLWAMGVHYPTLLAVFAALAWLIPWLGGVLVLLPVGLTAFSQSWVLGAGATAYAIGVLFFLEFVIQPRIIRRRQFSSLLSILLIIALAEPYGLLGFIVAPPLAAAIELIFRYNLQSRPQTQEARDQKQVSELHARIDRLRQVAEKNAENIEPQTLNLLSRLETLVDKADDVIVPEISSQKKGRRAQAAR
jgi:predicted PurR-regulated permease PerM